MMVQIAEWLCWLWLGLHEGPFFFFFWKELMVVKSSFFVEK